jgi:flagellar motor switch protein FliM
MDFECVIVLPMYTRNNKQYIDIAVPCTHIDIIRQIHDNLHSIAKRSHFQDPLEGSVLKVKVPYRNNRVSCKVTGLTPIQELSRGDTIKVHMKFCGMWYAGDYCGVAWKLDHVETPDRVGPRPPDTA